MSGMELSNVKPRDLGKTEIIKHDVINNVTVVIFLSF